MEPLVEDALQKLNVAGLRALCKERSIVGYSKAPRPALIQKLLDYQAGVAAALSTSVPAPPKATAKNPSKAKAPTTTRAPATSSTTPNVAASTANDPPPSQRPATSAPVAVSSSNPSRAKAPARPPIKHPTNDAGQRLCHGCTQPGRYKDSKCVEKWGPGPLGPGTLCGKCQTEHKRAAAQARGQAPIASASTSHATSLAPAPRLVERKSPPRNISMLSGPSQVSQLPDRLSLSSQLPLSQPGLALSPPAASQSRTVSGTDAARPCTPPVDLPPVKPTVINPPSVKKRKAQTQANEAHVVKKQKPTSASAAKPKSSTQVAKHVPNPVAATPTMPVVALSHVSPLVSAVPLPPPRKPLISTTVNAKRFAPLVVKQHIASPTKPLQPSLSQQGRSQIYLDFPTTVPASLDNITFPPKVGKRKYVPQYALFLSQVPEADLKPCMLVSRMFRYAAYISASYRLLHNFSGARFGLILNTYPSDMTDMWPYLRQRRAELAQRRTKYRASFLHAALKDKDLIAPYLWKSPDHEMQLTIAIRFILTRLFFCISLGQSSEWLDGQILDVQQVVAGEIWCITLHHSDCALAASFYVLEATCEVVGRPMNELLPLRNVPVRADWSDYIAQRAGPLTMHSVPPPPLMEHVKWTNHEEYERGISRHWLKRVRREGVLGAVKEVIAERYVLACVVDNSVSGQWKSSMEMEQDFAGRDAMDVGIVPYRPRVQKVNLFLPAHHHVESVHFKTVSGRFLHPALAIIQTPAREYFILKDNGMQVGSEEEGVAQVWMTLLKCANSGEMILNPYDT